MLQLMWLTGEQCDHVSRGTVDWLSSLVKKSIQTEQRQLEIEESVPQFKTGQSNENILMKTQATSVLSDSKGAILPQKKKRIQNVK